VTTGARGGKMKQEIMYFVFIMAYIPTYFAGYYAETTNGWSHLLIILTFLMQGLSLFFGLGKRELK